MDFRGESKLLSMNVLVGIIVLLFFAGSLYWINGYRNHAAFWEDFYAKEIARLIDVSEPNNELFIDVTQATRIAARENVDLTTLFLFDNEHHTVTVRLAPHSARSFSFFKNVTVINEGVDLFAGGVQPPVNRLHLRIT